MYLLLGDSRMESRDYKGAIQLFKRAQAQTRYHTRKGLSVITLVSELPNGYIATHRYRNRSQYLTDIWMEV